MPRLLLVRHAEAFAHAPEGDSDRPLTAQGRTNAAYLGSYLRTEGLVPDRAIVSPARRARDTLEAIVRELPHKPPSCAIETSLYNAGIETLLDVLARTSGVVTTLLIVGHNPGIAEFARFLVSDDSVLPKIFPAPCLAVLHFPYDDWSEAGAGSGRLDRFANFASTPPDDSLSHTNENG
jgi:phosphohistidine phosphatase